MRAGQAVNALCLIASEPIDAVTVTKAAILFDQNYGTKTAGEKWQMLSTMVREEGWTVERFERTLRHLLKSNRWAAWTIADWFSYGIELHPESWYQAQVAEHGASVNAQIEMYLVAESPCLIGYRYADGESLPFPRKMIRDKDWTQ